MARQAYPPTDLALVDVDHKAGGSLANLINLFDDRA